MGPLRDYRLTIPAGVLLLATVTTLLNDKSLAEEIRKLLAGNTSMDVLALLIGGLVGSYAIGYLLSLPIVFFTRARFSMEARISERLTLINTHYLAALPEFPELDNTPLDVSSFKNAIVHSYGNEGIRAFLTRRLTTLYVSWTCALSLLVGGVIGVALANLIRGGGEYCGRITPLLALLVCLLSWMLVRAGIDADREHNRTLSHWLRLHAIQITSQIRASDK